MNSSFGRATTRLMPAHARERVQSGDKLVATEAPAGTPSVRAGPTQSLFHAQVGRATVHCFVHCFIGIDSACRRIRPRCVCLAVAGVWRPDLRRAAAAADAPPTVDSVASVRTTPIRLTPGPASQRHVAVLVCSEQLEDAALTFVTLTPTLRQSILSLHRRAEARSSSLVRYQPALLRSPGAPSRACGVGTHVCASLLPPRPCHTPPWESRRGLVPRLSRSPCWPTWCTRRCAHTPPPGPIGSSHFKSGTVCVCVRRCRLCRAVDAGAVLRIRCGATPRTSADARQRRPACRTESNGLGSAPRHHACPLGGARLCGGKRPRV
jgi:hypothetical protein